MRPITPAPADLAVAIAALRLHDLTPALANVITFLVACKAVGDRPPVRVVPDMQDAGTWCIDERRYRFPKGSARFWTFYMAMRDGEAWVSWNYTSKAAVDGMRNARLRIIDNLRTAGFDALADEVAKCPVGDDGRVLYLPDQDSPVLLFE